MNDRKMFVGRWVSWVETMRVEQELTDDGTFEGVLYDEEAGAEFGSVKGVWEVTDDAILWRYKSAKGIPLPKKVDTNKILELEENRWVVKETSGSESEYFRATVKFDDTSMNFDLDEVESFLEKVGGVIDSGFGKAEIAETMKKLKKLKPEKTAHFVFWITYKGEASPLHFRAFMDDIDAPDIYFSASTKLTKQIDGLMEEKMK